MHRRKYKDHIFMQLTSRLKTSPEARKEYQDDLLASFRELSHI